MLLGQTGREFQSETSEKETCHPLKQWDLLAARRNSLIFHVSVEQKPVGGVSTDSTESSQACFFWF